MKKTAKLLTLAIALFVGAGNTAQAEGFEIGADVVSSYVWRGADLGDSPAIQPSLTYTFEGIGIQVGAWGSYAISEDTTTDDDGVESSDRYKEIDLFVSVPVGPATLTVTNYCAAPEGDLVFDFDDDGDNTVEVALSGEVEGVSLLASVFVAANDYDNAFYCEAGYQIYDREGYTASAFVGGGSEKYYGDAEDKGGFAVANTGISVSKDRYTAAYIYNPDQEKSYLTFMASF